MADTDINRAVPRGSGACVNTCVSSFILRALYDYIIVRGHHGSVVRGLGATRAHTVLAVLLLVFLLPLRARYAYECWRYSSQQHWAPL